MKLVSVQEMVRIEKEANSIGLNYEQMMENAGKGLAKKVNEIFGYMSDEGAIGLIGSGNNGGDTLIALSYLAEEGWPVSAYLVKPRNKDDLLLSRLRMAGGSIYESEITNQREILINLLSSHGVLLDGVLGTGIRLPLTQTVAIILDCVRDAMQNIEYPPFVIAVDCPSGADCDSGEIAPEAIPADVTVTMAAIKNGLLKFPAYNFVGDIHLVDIGLPNGGESLTTWRQVQSIVPDSNWVNKIMPKRPLDSHKGTFGTALIVAGSANYSGASLLAGVAAYRIGTGLVTMAIPASIHPALAGNFLEGTWILLPEKDGAIDHSALDLIINQSKKSTGVLIGPGLGLMSTTESFIIKVLDYAIKFPQLVIDADGLKHITRVDNWQQKIPQNTVLTPHPGEMSVLTNLSTTEIQKNRHEIAKKFSKQWGHIVVLKGAFTVIAEPNGKSAIIPVATPALARAGTGDILAGLIVGLCSQGVEPFNASVAAAWIHAQAGLSAATKLGSTASVIAGDILESLLEIISEVYPL